MKLNKDKMQNLIKVFLFCAILFMLFLFFTYLFRNTGRYGRENILEYYEEEENSLDVVVVGASNVIRYWDPMRAWNEYGFTSRNYATTGMHASTYLYALKDALKTQSPKVVIVEARLFTRSYAEKGVTVGGRNFLDSIDYDLFRMEAVNYYCKTLGIPWEDAISLYIDLIQYHDNYAALTDSEHWALADNRLNEVTDYKSMYKGYGFKDAVVAFADPTENAKSEKRGEVEANALKFYTDLIEYCKENDINLMIMASPIVINKTEISKLNTLADVAENYGVPFVNTNKLYDEMGLDFSQDFYDVHHTNVLGGDKFTDYMASYLVDNFDLPDHRGDVAYASWHDLYEDYFAESEKAREKVRKALEKNQAVLEVEEAMKVCENPAEWFRLAKNSKITLLMAANELPEGVPSEESQNILSKVGITEEYFKGDGTLKVVYNRKVRYSDFSSDEKSGKVGERKTKYTITVGEEPQILVKKQNYYDASQKGVHIVAFDNNTEEIFDVICLNVAKNGSLRMER